MALPMIGGILGRSGQAAAAREQAKKYNQYLRGTEQGQQRYLDYLQGYDPTSRQYGTTSGTTSEDFSGTSESAPTISAQFSPLVARMTQIASQRIAGPGAGLPAGYAENAIRAINEGAAGVEQSERNRAARLGLSASALGPVSAAGRERAGAIASFRGELPLKARELENQDIGLAQQLAEIFGRGQRTAQRGTRRGTTTGETFGMTRGPQPLAQMGAFLPPGPYEGTAGLGRAQLAGGAADLQALIDNIARSMVAAG